MGFQQYPPPPSQSAGAITSATPITGNPPDLDTAGEMALAIQTNTGLVNGLSTQVSGLTSQVASLALTVSTLPPVNDIMLKTEYDIDGNIVADVVDLADGGVI